MRPCYWGVRDVPVSLTIIAEGHVGLVGIPRAYGGDTTRVPARENIGFRLRHRRQSFAPLCPKREPPGITITTAAHTVSAC